MTLVRSLAVGNGDMFYILHESDSFTILDCSLPDDRSEFIKREIAVQSGTKGVVRFISTHPDDDHISGLAELDDELQIPNFYCVDNDAWKPDPTVDFERYCQLRDHPRKAFHIRQGARRKWLNREDDERGSAGLRFLWPDVESKPFKEALAEAAEGRPNNISCITQYSRKLGASILWMGDLEADFMDELVELGVSIERADILFAPHHGRASGRVPADWMHQIDPYLVVIGEAPSEHLDYYTGYNTITQHSAGDITFDCLKGWTHVYVSALSYSVDFLADELMPDTSYGRYIGTIPH